MGLGLDGTPCEYKKLSGIEDFCLLIRVSWVRVPHGLQNASFEANFAQVLPKCPKTKPLFEHLIRGEMGYNDAD